MAQLHVLVYHGPLLSHLLGVKPSIFTTVYIQRRKCDQCRILKNDDIKALFCLRGQKPNTGPPNNAVRQEVVIVILNNTNLGQYVNSKIELSEFSISNVHECR